MINTAPLSKFILKSQSIQYAVFDQQWRLISASGGLAELLLREAAPGLPLDELLPEVGGMTASIRESLASGRNVEIDHVARPDWHDGGYMSLQFLNFEDKFILLVKDTSLLGQMEQRLMQKRNELALLTAQLEKSQKQLLNLTTRFMPGQVFDALMASREIPTVKGCKREATIVFADLRGFSRWAEEREPEEIFDTINLFLAQAVEIAQTYNGTLDKFLGDGFMVIFNAPHDQPDHIIRAVQFAGEISKLEHGGLRFGLGVHSGWVMAGNIGGEQALNYTALGHTVNQARRIEESAPAGEVLLSENVAQAVAERCATEPFGNLSTSNPFPLYRLVKKIQPQR